MELDFFYITVSIEKLYKILPKLWVASLTEKNKLYRNYKSTKFSFHPFANWNVVSINAIENRHRHNKDRYHRSINTDFMALLPNSSSSQQPVVRIRSRGGKSTILRPRIDKVKLLTRNSPAVSNRWVQRERDPLFNIRREPDVKHAPEMRFCRWTLARARLCLPRNFARAD